MNKRTTQPILPARQARFVEEYVLDGNGAGAAVRAGYAPGSARVTASRLLTKANVRRALAAIQQQVAKRHRMDRNRVLQGLLDAVADAKAQADPSSMIRGWTEIGRICGLYEQEKIVKVHPNVSAKRNVSQIESIPDDELLKLVDLAD